MGFNDWDQLNKETINKWGTMYATLNKGKDAPPFYIYCNLIEKGVSDYTELKKLIIFLYNAFFYNVGNIDLALMCDVAYYNKDKILNEKDFSIYDLYNLCKKEM